MEHPFHYIGCFFSRDALWEILAPCRHAALENPIQAPHITFAYEPEEVDTALFGKEIWVTVIGYGNNGRNEAVKVTLHSEDPTLEKMIRQIPVPHITLSVSEGAEPVDSRYLDFTPIAPIQIKGTFGGFTQDREVILEAAP